MSSNLSLIAPQRILSILIFGGAACSAISAGVRCVLDRVTAHVLRLVTWRIVSSESLLVVSASSELELTSPTGVVGSYSGLSGESVGY